MEAAGFCISTGGAAASCSIGHDVEIRRIQDDVVAIPLRDGRQRMELRSFIFAGVQAKPPALTRRESRMEPRYYAVLFLQEAYRMRHMAAVIYELKIEGWSFEV